MLEYAAHASETWTAEDLRETFERGAAERGSVPREELAWLLQTGAEADADAFWENVATNLAANRLRLLFISDRIPDELARVVTFLNEQTRDIEVLAVETKRFRGETNQTLVPRVIGRTTRGAKASRGRTGSPLTRDSFLEGFADEGVRGVASDLLDVAQQGGARIAYGRSFGLSIRVPCDVPSSNSISRSSRFDFFGFPPKSRITQFCSVVRNRLEPWIAVKVGPADPSGLSKHLSGFDQHGCGSSNPGDAMRSVRSASPSFLITANLPRPIFSSNTTSKNACNGTKSFPDYVRTSCSRLHTGAGNGFGPLTWRRAAHLDRFGGR